jgi:hypothetical protein
MTKKLSALFNSAFQAIYPYLIPVVIGTSVLFGLLAEALGIRFRAPFFSASAQIFPLLLVAMFVELAGVHQRFTRGWRKALDLKVNENDPTLASDAEAFQKDIAVQARKMTWLVLIGEAAALYSLAGDDQGTLLASLCLICMVTTVYLLMTAYLARISPIQF